MQSSFFVQTLFCCFLYGLTLFLVEGETCHNGYSCALDTITGQPQCYGYASCTEADINTANIVYCYGSYSCYQATRIRQPSTTHYNIHCHGLFSCAEVPNLYIQDGHVNCHGELSCFNTTLTILEDHLYCYGDHSCSDSLIYSRNNNYLYGFAAAQGAIFYSQDTSVLYHFYGRSSGDGATIYCGNGAICYVYCHQDSCSNLELSCSNGEGTCTFSVDCTYAEASDNCPDGYISSSVFDELDISGITMSTYENSVSSCLTNSQTNAINCDDYLGCQGDTIDNQENSAPVCCTGTATCQNAYEISTAVSVNSTYANGVAIRCDGGSACYSIDNGIYSGSRGNIYFGGYYSGYQVTSVVGQYGFTDIFCSGYLSCRYSYNMRNANNLYCGGVQGCEYAVISHFKGNIYAYGTHGAQYATISDIGGTVYCGAYQACYSSHIRGISNLFSSGTNALSDSKIISELGGGTLTVTIEGTNSETLEIYCNTTDICKIACKTEDACETVELRCDYSTCFVDCDESRGIKCPFYGFYEYYNSSEGIGSDKTTTLPATTESPDSNYECDLDNDGVVLSWDEFFDDPSFIDDETEIELIQGVNDITNTFEVTVSITAKYLVASTYDEYSSYYQGITENDMLGITYILDVNPFDASERLIENANNCENRNSSSFNGKNFLSDYWDYTLYPGNSSQLGNDKYLEYGDQNIWDITLVGDGCNKIRWTHTFAFDELFGTCSDGDDNAAYTMTETASDITFEANFYLTLVSPDPLFLTVCSSGNTDCGRYLTGSLLSHHLSVSFPKQQRTISDNNNVLVDLFTSNIVGATFIEEDTLIFELILRTTVPVAIVLDASSATILSPTESDLININGGNDFIQSITIVENFNDYVSGDCLLETAHRCWQEFSIIIQVTDCPSNTGLVFDGDYYFSANFICRDTSGDGIVNATEQAACDEYNNVQGDSSNPYKITLESTNLQYTESCDATAYDVDWTGSVIFYGNNEFSNEKNEFTGGNTVYTRISVYDDVNNYDLFGMSIQECYVCVSNINDTSIASLGDITTNGCLDTNYVDTDQVYNLDEDGLNFELLNSNVNDTFEDFSFTLPTFASSSVTVFYVDCVIELGLSSGGQGTRRRSRRVARMRARNMLQDGFSGNAFENVIGYGFYEQNGASDDGNNNEDVLTPEFWYILAIGVILTVLIVVILVAVWCIRKAKQGAGINEGAAADIIKSGKLSIRATSLSRGGA